MRRRNGRSVGPRPAGRPARRITGAGLPGPGLPGPGLRGVGAPGRGWRGAGGRTPCSREGTDLESWGPWLFT